MPISSVSLQIEEKNKSYAKIYSSLINSEYQRKRAYASLTALYALISLVEKTNYEVQKSMTVFRTPELNEKYEISDFYVNDWHIDVRILTKGNAFLVPKIHSESLIEPDFYAVVKIDSRLQNAELLGFARPSAMVKDVYDYNYYSVSNNSLINYEEFLDIVEKKKVVKNSADEHEFFKESFLSLVDNETDIQTKNKILAHMFNCNKCRTEFCCFSGFEMVNCHAGEYPEILKDQTLDIVGAQAVDNPIYSDKEETIYIGDEDVKQDDIIADDETIIDEEVDKQPDETVSDILDELFNMEEETIQPDKSGSDAVIDVIPDKITNNEDNDFVLLDENSDVSEEFMESPDAVGDIELIMGDSEELVVDNELNDNLNLTDSGENDDLILHEEDNETEIIEEIPDLTENKQDNIEKVIVDYDEFGEPIYSYITSVNSDESAEELSLDLETDNNDILGEENNTAESFDENLSDENEEITYQNNEDAHEEYKNDDLNDSMSDEHTYEESEPESSQVSQIDSSSDDLFSDEEDDNSQVNDFGDNEEDKNLSDEKFDEEKEIDAGSEIEEDEEELDIGIPLIREQKSSKKGLVVAILAVMLASVGSLYAYKAIKSANEVSSVPPQAEVPDNSAINDMFEQSVNEPPTENDITAANDNPENNINTENNANPGDAIEIPQEQPQNVQTEEIEIPVQNNDIEVPGQLTEKDLTGNQNNSSGDINKVMSNAFSQGGTGVSVSGVNWLCAPELFTDKEFKNYLQNLDKVLKLNLNKNILDAAETPQNNVVTVKIAVDNNGNLLKYIVANSSGSNQIDNIVLQSIKETFDIQKAQILSNSAQKSDKYYLQVAIKL